MKNIFSFATVTASFTIFCAAHAMPHSTLQCRTTDAKLTLAISGLVRTASGELTQDGLRYTDDVESKIPYSRVTQFKNFDGELFIKANLNDPETQGPFGFVIETKQNPKAEDKFAYTGTIKKFENPDGALEVYENVVRPMTCSIDP